MELEAKSRLSVSVRNLVEFILRRGDLAGSGRFVAPGRALEGTRAHQREQRRRPAGYQSEVAVKHEIDAGDFVLQIKGRIDGMWEQPDGLLLEEIKSVDPGWDGQPAPLHWAQGQVYAQLYLLTRPHLEKAQVRLIYIDLETDQQTVFDQRFERRELEAFFDDLVTAYLKWARRQHEWHQLRNQSIGELTFPFAAYRPGQRQLAVAVYRTVVKEARLFVEAPTGIGKTVSVLFPAIKSMREGHTDKIFYLTAKTIGRTAAEQAIHELRSRGLKLRVLTLTAREKICFGENGVCDVQTCPYAMGYYDRLKDALWDCLERENLTRSTIEEVARKHQVCPFALSLDAALWMDVIICDYNYVFDPKVYLRRFFAETVENYLLLIDEAHNLLERAREMFSAEITSAEVTPVMDAIGIQLPECFRALGKVQTELHQLGQARERPKVWAEPELPQNLVRALKAFAESAETWLARNEPALFREALLQLYFRALGFGRTSESFDQRYMTLVEPQKSDLRVRLYCLDPAYLLHEALERVHAAIFFSATLSPLDYFRDTLGGERGDELLRLGSPFPSENLCLLAGVHVATRFKQRAGSHAAIAAAIGAVIRAQPGNYLVYFPSYDYLQQVLQRMAHLDATVIAQVPGMSEAERERFINEFAADRKDTLVGFAVLGGVFGEGIDLVGERLSGAVVVGVGLPQLSVERDLIRAYFEEKNGAGFDYAYVFPGMNRVLQAAGRVIRSETDRGIVLLLDTRFGEYRYRELFPSWWNVQIVTSAAEITQKASRFWILDFGF